PVKAGTLRTYRTFVTYNPGSAGTLTLAGGTNTVEADINIAGDNNTTGTVWVTGGTLLGTNASVEVGDHNVGQLTVSNGSVLVQSLSVGLSAGSQGTLTVAGGTTTLGNVLNIGSFPNATGTVRMSGGLLLLTNATLYVGDGGVGQMSV